MKKRNVITSTIVIAVTAIILALAMTACVPKEAVEEETVATLDTTPTETQMVETEPTVEETEAPTEAPTEPEETKPEEAAPKATTAPAVNTGNHTNANTTGTNNGSSTGTVAVTPTATEPATVETPNAIPAPTPTEPVPAVTEPAPTEHVHSWQVVYHEENSHEVVWYVCGCGSYFSAFEEYQSHRNGFSGEDIIVHSHWGTVTETIVDTPAYSTWGCACGATSDTQP